MLVELMETKKLHQMELLSIVMKAITIDMWMGHKMESMKVLKKVHSMQYMMVLMWVVLKDLMLDRWMSPVKDLMMVNIDELEVEMEILRVLWKDVLMKPL